MAKSRANIESKLERLQQLRDESPSPAVLKELKAAVRDSSNHVVAAAARLVARFRYSELAPDLASEFEWFLDDPLKSDKTCAGKIAIMEALNELDFQESDVFIAGARHVQIEPAWPQSVDTAAPRAPRAREGSCAPEATRRCLSSSTCSRTPIELCGPPRRTRSARPDPGPRCSFCV